MQNVQKWALFQPKFKVHGSMNICFSYPPTVSSVGSVRWRSSLKAGAASHMFVLQCFTKG